MKRTTIGFIVATLTLSAGAVAQEGPIKYRQGVMTAIGGHAGAIAQITYGGVGHKAHLITHAESMAALSKMVVTAFEQNAEPTADVGTRAKEAVWKN